MRWICTWTAGAFVLGAVGCGVVRDGDAPLTVTRGPYLQMGTPDAVVVRWRTSAPTESRIWLGPAGGHLWAHDLDPTPKTEHEMTVAGLTPETAYVYAVGHSGGMLAGDGEHRFVTAPPLGARRPVRIWVLGDSGTADESAASVHSAYLDFTGERRTDVWLMLGDNAYPDGTDSQYQHAVFEMFPQMLRQTVLWPTLGNHDSHRADSVTESGPYYEIFTLPRKAEAGGLPSGTEAYYSLDFANIHFICLNSCDTDRNPGGAMLTWLAADLADTLADWIIAYWHHPPYSKGSHDSDTNDSSGRLREMRENVLPILEAGGVDLVLTGHSHSYERSFMIDGVYGYDDGKRTPDFATLAVDGRILDAGDGCADGDGAYKKPPSVSSSRDGAVYVVAGCAGKVSGGSLDHPVMCVSFNMLGSLVLEVDGLQLDATFLHSTGAALDTFTIEKKP